MKNIERLFVAMYELGVPFVNASKEMKRLAKDLTDLDMARLKRRERYLRYYRNHSKIMVK